MSKLDEDIDDYIRGLDEEHYDEASEREDEWKDDGREDEFDGELSEEEAIILGEEADEDGQDQ